MQGFIQHSSPCESQIYVTPFHQTQDPCRSWPPKRLATAQPSSSPGPSHRRRPPGQPGRGLGDRQHLLDGRRLRHHSGVRRRRQVQAHAHQRRPQEAARHLRRPRSRVSKGREEHWTKCPDIGTGGARGERGNGRNFLTERRTGCGERGAPHEMSCLRDGLGAGREGHHTKCPDSGTEEGRRGRGTGRNVLTQGWAECSKRWTDFPAKTLNCAVNSRFEGLHEKVAWHSTRNIIRLNLFENDRFLYLLQMRLIFFGSIQRV